MLLFFYLKPRYNRLVQSKNSRLQKLSKNILKSTKEINICAMLLTPKIAILSPTNHSAIFNTKRKDIHIDFEQSLITIHSK